MGVEIVAMGPLCFCFKTTGTSKLIADKNKCISGGSVDIRRWEKLWVGKMVKMLRLWAGWKVAMRAAWHGSTSVWLLAGI